MAKRTNYAKESKKSNPTTIRYDLVEYDLAITKSGKTSVQSLFDFLLRQYVYGVPFAPPQPVYDAPKLPTTVNDELKQWQEGKVNQFQAYATQIKQAGSFYELGVVMHEVGKDKSLSLQDKMKLTALGEQMRSNLNF